MTHISFSPDGSKEVAIAKNGDVFIIDMDPSVIFIKFFSKKIFLNKIIYIIGLIIN